MLAIFIESLRFVGRMSLRVPRCSTKWSPKWHLSHTTILVVEKHSSLKSWDEAIDTLKAKSGVRSDTVVINY